jgi:tetratricopeptide (TPR) repeat protein
MSVLRLALSLLALLCATATLAQAIAGRADALDKLSAAAAAERAEAVLWFVNNGAAADDVHLLPRLGDESRAVRQLAEQGMWILWSRSGDPQVDALMEKGIEQMQARQFGDAIATYSEVIRRKPSFAEGWNKRATVHFLAGDFGASLADCDEVMKRNPYHFGALSGYGQIYFQRKQYDKAITYWQRALKVNPNLVLQGNIEAARKLLANTRKRSV